MGAGQFTSIMEYKPHF